MYLFALDGFLVVSRCSEYPGLMMEPPLMKFIFNMPCHDVTTVTTEAERPPTILRRCLSKRCAEHIGRLLAEILPFTFFFLFLRFSSSFALRAHSPQRYAPSQFRKNFCAQDIYGINHSLFAIIYSYLFFLFITNQSWFPCVQTEDYEVILRPKLKVKC